MMKRAVFKRPYRLLDAAKSKEAQQDYESRALVEMGTYELVEIPNPYFGDRFENWWVIKDTTLGMSITTWIESRSIEVEVD